MQCNIKIRLLVTLKKNNEEILYQYLRIENLSIIGCATNLCHSHNFDSNSDLYKI
jgi:hypothetical protein